PGRCPATAVTAPGRCPVTAMTAPDRCAARPAYAHTGLGARGPKPALRLAGAAPALLPRAFTRSELPPRCDCAGRLSRPFAPILPTGQSGATPASGPRPPCVLANHPVSPLPESCSPAG